MHPIWGRALPNRSGEDSRRAFVQAIAFVAPLSNALKNASNWNC